MNINQKEFLFILKSWCVVGCLVFALILMARKLEDSDKANKNKPSIQWIGYLPVASNERVGWMPHIELGLCENGTLVWRTATNNISK